MNARLYDPVLGRFYAPDPFVASDLTNDFNRYIYGRNNPMMYIDPSGKSLWSWLKRNVVDPFSREWNHVFGNGFTVSFGTNTQFSSANAIIAPNGANGMPYGPGFGIQTNNWKTVSPVYANYQGGFFNTQPITLESNLHQSVVYAEQSARSEYFENKNLNSSWTETFNKWNGGIGVLAAGVENLSGKVTIGIQNLTFYFNGWSGNQYIKALKVTEIGKFVGWSTLGAGTVIDLYGVNKYYTNGTNDPNAVSPAKASLNLGVGMWSLLNPATAIGGALYYGIGTFYPGGWQGAAEMNNKLLQQNQELLGKNWNLYRDF